MSEHERSDTFVVYRSFWDNIRNWHRLGVIDSEAALNVFFAMGDLGFDGEEAELTLLEEAVFAPIRPLIAASRKRYEEACSGGRKPSGVTAEEILAKKEELGSVKAAAEFYGISERTAYYKLSELQRLQKLQLQPAKLQKPNDNDHVNKNENQKLAVAVAVAPAPVASSSRAGAVAGGSLAFMSEEEEQQAQAIFDKWKKPPASATEARNGKEASKKKEAGKQLSFDFLIAESQRKIDEARDNITRAWYLGEKRSYEDAKKLVESEGTTQQVMQRIKESAENARKRCDRQDLPQEMRTQARAYSRASLRVLDSFFDNCAAGNAEEA